MTKQAVKARIEELRDFDPAIIRTALTSGGGVKGRRLWAPGRRQETKEFVVYNSAGSQALAIMTLEDMDKILRTIAKVEHVPGGSISADGTQFAETIPQGQNFKRAALEARKAALAEEQAKIQAEIDAVGA